MIRSILIALTLGLVSVSAVLAQDATLRMGGGVDRVSASGDYDATVFARRLGHVSALARDDDGTIYTADQDGGRIFRIQDRRQDGTADITQALPQQFDRPTGLAVTGDRLFVADQGGLWRVQPGGGTPTLIAPFANSGSTGEAHPLTWISPTALLLGLSRTDGTARLLEIDTASGRATLREETRGHIIGFASLGRGDSEEAEFPRPWILLRRDNKTLFGSTLETARDIGVDAQAVWIDEAKGRANIALPDGVYTTMATFTGLKDKGTPIMSGFRGAARPGVMLSDARGLFVSDQAGGRLWRVAPKPAPLPIVTAPRPSDTAADNSGAESQATDVIDDGAQRPELMRGSGIERASTIGRGSTMPTASTLPEADQPRAASDPSE
jgi:hypothetical protein